MASNESAFENELGGWNIAETVTVEARPVETADYSGFEL